MRSGSGWASLRRVGIGLAAILKGLGRWKGSSALGDWKVCTDRKGGCPIQTSEATCGSAQRRQLLQCEKPVQHNDSGVCHSLSLSTSSNDSRSENTASYSHAALPGCRSNSSEIVAHFWRWQRSPWKAPGQRGAARKGGPGAHHGRAARERARRAASSWSRKSVMSGAASCTRNPS